LIDRTTVQPGSSTTCSASWPSLSAPSEARTATATAPRRPIRRDDRIVPAIDERGHGVRRPEVDPQTHGA
jgi:hypothetical protein